MEDKIFIREVVPKTKGKMYVSFDNGISCLLYRSEIKNFRIEEGAEISAPFFDKLMQEYVGKRAKKRAMHLLEQMDRTEKQLRDKLALGQYPSFIIDEAIAYVKKFHYLDDQRYAENFIRFSQEKLSRGKIKEKLMNKGLASYTIEAALEEFYESDEEEQIIKLLEKKHFSAEQADQKEFYKVYQYCLRRGFKSSQVLKCMKREDFDSNNQF